MSAHRKTEPVRAVIFDLDGTLLDHESSVRSALYDWLPAFAQNTDELDVVPGFRRESAEFERLATLWLTLADQHLPAGIATDATWTEQRRQRLRAFLPALGIATAEDHLDELFARYLQCYEANWQLFDDVKPCLNLLAQQRLAVAVLTNGVQAQQVAKTVATQIADLVGPVFASRGIGVAKPDSASYLLVCERLGLGPDEVVMVGDNYELDVRGPRSAGLRAVHLDRSGSNPIPDPCRVVTLAELDFLDPKLGLA